jgi:hypothetical protein
MRDFILRKKFSNSFSKYEFYEKTSIQYSQKNIVWKGVEYFIWKLKHLIEKKIQKLDRDYTKAN